MGIHAALADQAQVRQPLEQLVADLRPLADQDERVEALQVIYRAPAFDERPAIVAGASLSRAAGLD